MKQLSLCSELEFHALETEGIKYTGSKLKLLPYIHQLANKVDARTVFDGFSGTTRVSQSFARNDFKVICNDIAVWSEIFGICYLQNKNKHSHYKQLIQHLNSLKPIDGWFTENYGGLPNNGGSIQSDGLKRPWQIHNTRKLDAIREEIDKLSLPKIEKCVALTSLILALDRVDSTIGHFVSYLQDWSPRSYNHLLLEIPQVFVNMNENEVFCCDIFDLLPKINVDLAYYDPPYGSNNEKMPPSRVRYASYYHLWTTICLNDRPELVGKAKRRADSSDTVAASVFEEFRKNEDGKFLVVEAIEKMIQRTNAHWIILSYSSGGRATAEELNEVLNKNGKILEVIKLDYKKNVMSQMKWTNDWLRDSEIQNREFLFLIEK